MTHPQLSFERVPIDGDVLICPRFRCVTCGEPVTDPRAIVVKPRDEDHHLTGEFFVAHRGQCDTFRDEGWDHLDTFLCNLVFNSRVSAEELRGLLKAVEDRERAES